MDNKSLKISGTVELQTKQAEEAMKKIVKQFQGVDKNSFNKLNEDFRKLSPLIKSLDKDLFKMMNTMSKKDAKNQLDLMNKALADQAKLIKDNIKQFQDLTEQIEASGDATGELSKKRSGLVADKRAIMTKMEEHGQRRDEAKEALGGGIGPAKLIAAAVGVEVASKVAQSLVSHFTGREMRKQGYEAQSAEVNNQLASLATSGSLAYGTAKSSGKLNSAYAAADQKSQGEWDNRYIQGFGDVASGALSGAGVAGPWGAFGGAVAGGAKVLGDNADALDDNIHDAYKQSLFQQNRGAALNNALAPNAFKVSMQDQLMGKASGRMGTMEAISGYGNNGSAQLHKDLWQGASRGFSQGETQQMAAGLGQSGLIGSERQDINPLMRMQRQGLAGAAESTGMAAQMGGVLSNQTKVMKTFEKSMAEGVKTGIEKSLVKDLTMAATSIAAMGTSRVSDLTDIMTGLKTTLGGGDPGKIGKQDVKEALEVNQAQKQLMQGGGTAEGKATQFVRSSHAAEQAGFKNLDLKTQMLLAQATSSQEVSQNPVLMAKLAQAQQTPDALANLLGTQKGDTDRIGDTRKKGSFQLMAQNGITEAGALSTDEGYAQMKKALESEDYIDKKTGKKGKRYKDATAAAGAEAQLNEVAATAEAEMMPGFDTGQKAQKWKQSFGVLEGSESDAKNKKGLMDADKSAEGAMAKFAANLDNTKDKLALVNGGWDQMKAAMKTTTDDLTKLAGGANSAITPMDKLDLSLMMLKDAVDANTKAHGGKAPGQAEDGTGFSDVIKNMFSKETLQSFLHPDFHKQSSTDNLDPAAPITKFKASSGKKR